MVQSLVSCSPVPFAIQTSPDEPTCLAMLDHSILNNSCHSPMLVRTEKVAKNVTKAFGLAIIW